MSTCGFIFCGTDVCVDCPIRIRVHIFPDRRRIERDWAEAIKDDRERTAFLTEQRRQARAFAKRSDGVTITVGE